MLDVVDGDGGSDDVAARCSTEVRSDRGLTLLKFADTACWPSKAYCAEHRDKPAGFYVCHNSDVGRKRQEMAWWI